MSESTFTDFISERRARREFDMSRSGWFKFKKKHWLPVYSFTSETERKSRRKYVKRSEIEALLKPDQPKTTNTL